MQLSNRGIAANVIAVAILTAALTYVLTKQDEATYLSDKLGGPTTVLGVAQLVESSADACRLGFITKDFGDLDSVYKEAGSCTVSEVQFDITIHPSRGAMFEALEITDDGFECLLAKARKSNRFWIVSENLRSIYLA
jgi:hypothetical protein